MLQLRFLGSLAGLLLSSSALASPPNVAVDISPVHSLVTQVMYGVATPDLLIQPEASPHSYSLRPSEAQALSDADIVFWMSEGLTPWLEKSLDTLSSKAHKVEMIAVKGTTVRAFREGATFEGHDDHDEHEGEQQSDDHANHEEAHQDHEPGWFDQFLSLFSSDDHVHEHEEEAHHDDHHDEHNHEGEDPHAWLDPLNAKVWVLKIRDVLVAHDPENAVAYEQNAEKTLARLDQQIDTINQATQQMDQLQFIVFHDAYQYFERRFGVLAAGSISLGDAQDPSPARVGEIRDVVKKLNITCVFSEPQYNAGLVNSVFEGTSVKTIGIMDPLGANIKVGKDQYEQLLNSMLSSLKQCES
jgi:zinc transport system substrate-binding protein